MRSLVTRDRFFSQKHKPVRFVYIIRICEKTTKLISVPKLQGTALINQKQQGVLQLKHAKCGLVIVDEDLYFQFQNILNTSFKLYKFTVHFVFTRFWAFVTRIIFIFNYKLLMLPRSESDTFKNSLILSFPDTHKLKNISAADFIKITGYKTGNKVDSSGGHYV